MVGTFGAEWHKRAIWTFRIQRLVRMERAVRP